MQRRRVNSARIRSAGYDEKTLTLEIEFANGEVLRYARVSPEVYRRLMAAPNPAAFFDDRIADEYRAERVRS